MLPGAPVVKDLVLLGGGHSHVEVLRSFGMRPMPGVRLTLITRDMMTPYSGMLPGYISGFYSHDDCHIDLARLASFARARLIHAEAVKIDTKSRRIFVQPHAAKIELTGGLAVCEVRPPISYDTLSIGIGITPGKEAVPGAALYTTGVKPIDQFVSKLEALLDRYRLLVATSSASSESHPAAGSSGSMRVVVVGGGAGGVEVALSLQYRLEEERRKLAGGEGCKAQVTLVCRGMVLDRSTGYVRAAFQRLLRQKGIRVVEGGGGVAEVHDGTIRLAALSPSSEDGTQATPTVDGGELIPFDECLWCTQASAASWLKETGLPTDPSGFLLVNDCLQSDGGPDEIFATGDVASCTSHPRPKAGVFAVRQGPPLAANLRRHLSGQPLVPFIPQSTFLNLITAGGKYCVGTKGWVSLEGGWLWAWKDSIDRTFMRKYGDDLALMAEKMMLTSAKAGPSAHGMGWGLPETSAPSWLSVFGSASRSDSSTTGSTGSLAGRSLGVEAAALFAEARMRCGGCGSKVGAGVLSRVLARLPTQPASTVKNAGVVVGLDSPDDAAVVRPPPPGHVLIQTVDFFKSLMGDSGDPYVFGKIAANHALSDCFAMGGRPATAMATAMVPFAAEEKMEEDLAQMMSGAMQALNQAGCVLVGGHTSEGENLGLGFAITGFAKEDALMIKGGLCPGQILILTKPLGTGIMMKAFMKGQAVGKWLPSTLSHCQSSNGPAAEVLAMFGCTGCTDVTGFGLVGHLVEMARPAKVHIELNLDALPLLNGAVDLLTTEGMLSSLHTSNARAAASISNFVQLKRDERWPILVDPQTGGGLLAGVAPSQADACIKALQEAGYGSATIIGAVTSLAPPAAAHITATGWGLVEP